MKSKLVKCKSCGTDIAKSASRCPQCGAKQHQAVWAVCILIIIFTAIFCAYILIQAEKQPASGSEPSHAQNSAADTSSAPSASGPVLLVDGSYIKSSYVEVFESPDVKGVFYLRLQVENKSEKEIWVSLIDASVNGVSTTVMSGVPMTIAAGESSKSPFIISYSNLDITELNQLSGIQFKFSVASNADMSTLEETDYVTIPFQS